MIDAASTIAGLIVGGGLGTIAGGLFAGGRAKEKIEALERELKLSWEMVRVRGIELADLRAWKLDRLRPLKLANAARHAKAEAAKAAARELQNARHAEMKRLVGEVI